MAPVARRFVDDDDLDDDGNGPFDPGYPGQRVIADRGRVRVPVYMTDGVPDWMRPSSRGQSLTDAEQDAEAAYYERSRRLSDAWRSSANPPPPALRDGQSARDQYVERVTNAWRPPGSNDPAEVSASPASDIAALQRRWASPGATPGPGRRPTQDAAAGRAEADQAYAEYCARLQSAWK